MLESKGLFVFLFCIILTTYISMKTTLLILPKKMYVLHIQTNTNYIYIYIYIYYILLYVCVNIRCIYI